MRNSSDHRCCRYYLLVLPLYICQLISTKPLETVGIEHHLLHASLVVGENGGLSNRRFELVSSVAIFDASICGHVVSPWITH